ncbi:50S ribosomal protein L30 [Candidatus Desantisbacteria bacterium]|nr:50S ribosomal protein L30 [Candidatus Desantisbacteria bacterium]
MSKETKKITITLVKSLIGVREKHRNTIKALGLHKIGSSVTQINSTVISGMIDKVNYLLKIEEVK